MQKSQLRLDMGEEKWREYQKKLKSEYTKKLKAARVAAVKPTITHKQCFFCKQTLEIANFHAKPATLDGYDPRCIQCQRLYNQDYYKRNSEVAIAKTSKEARRKVEWLAEYKKTLKCSKCPENHIACLQFHHRDSSQKEFTISTAIRRYSLEKIIEEIAKCDVLCANCHFKLHYEERNGGVV